MIPVSIVFRLKFSFSWYNILSLHNTQFNPFRRLEDGTIPYLSIISLLNGFETLERLVPGDSMHRISQHCFNLAKYLYESLQALKYPNGQKVVRFYHDSTFESVERQGGIVTFNVLNDDGTYVGFAEVSYDSLYLYLSLPSNESFLNYCCFVSSYRCHIWLICTIFICAQDVFVIPARVNDTSVFRMMI